MNVNSLQGREILIRHPRSQFLRTQLWDHFGFLKKGRKTNKKKKKRKKKQESGFHSTRKMRNSWWSTRIGSLEYWTTVVVCLFWIQCSCGMPHVIRIGKKPKTMSWWRHTSPSHFSSVLVHSSLCVCVRVLTHPAAGTGVPCWWLVLNDAV